ncbi:MAG TPA: DUF4411 family protein [Candidatus Glassbacteria bacterium]|nr:DUF4411 family protein [Candidatus Glassbacteria bacterium]
MYLFDTNIFYSLSVFYPENFPSVWEDINSLATNGNLISVREVYREVLKNCPEEHIEFWVIRNKKLFVIPDENELKYLLTLMKSEENRNLIKLNNITKGLPVADPFIITVAKHRNAIVVTQEGRNPGARIPYICSKQNIEYLSLRGFFNKENIKY